MVAFRVFGFESFLVDITVLQVNNYMMMNQDDAEKEADDYEDKMKENLNVNQIGQRILQMKIKAPENKEGFHLISFFFFWLHFS